MNFQETAQEPQSNAPETSFRETSGCGFVMIEGFLCAGKTSFINRYAKWLESGGYTVALVANDQGVGLGVSPLMFNRVGNEGRKD